MALNITRGIPASVTRTARTSRRPAHRSVATATSAAAASTTTRSLARFAADRPPPSRQRRARTGTANGLPPGCGNYRRASPVRTDRRRAPGTACYWISPTSRTSASDRPRPLGGASDHPWNFRWPGPDLKGPRSPLPVRRAARSPDRCTCDERRVATMADVTAIQRSAVASFLRARLNEEAQAGPAGNQSPTAAPRTSPSPPRWHPHRPLGPRPGARRRAGPQPRAGRLRASPRYARRRPGASCGGWPGSWPMLALAQPYREHPHFHPAWYQ
jgi:hypothetical protein